MEENKNHNIKILVACHKADQNIRQDDIYMPIQVGKALHPDLDLGFQCDNEGDNISHKNESYCELTAVYWAWKNLKDVDYIGLSHYRRYFDFDKKGFSAYNFVPIPYDKGKDENRMQKLLSKNDVIISTPIILPFEVKVDYSLFHFKDDIKIIRDIIQNNFNEYLKDFDDVMDNNKYSPCNMFVMSKTLFDKYCSWLFNILELAESKIDISNYDFYQKRIYGFIAERLLNVFISHEIRVNKDFRVCNRQICMITEKKNEYANNHLKNNIIDFLNKIRKQIIYRLYKVKPLDLSIK